MKKCLYIQALLFLLPTISRSTVGQQIFDYPLTYTITKDVVVYSSTSYAFGEVMVGINNGWTNGNASGAVKINQTIKYNNYNYTVGRLAKWAFRENTQMTSISIPNTIKTIEQEAFYNCTSLRAVTITPHTDYNSIAQSAFYGCESLESVDFSGTTLYVGENAFYGCRNLQSFPFEKVPYISNSSFYGCETLSSITLNMENIGNNAFENCTSLSSVTFTSNQLNIGSNAFKGCEKLRRVTSYMDSEHFTSLPSDNCFSGISPKAVLYVPNGMKSYYENDANWHAAFPQIQAIAPSLGETFSADIPVGNQTMRLTFEVINVENMEVEITSSECNITSSIDLILPTEISYLDWDFSIVGIRASVFTDIQNIQTITVGWRQPFDVSNNFSNIPVDAILYVPAGTKNRYEAIESWQNFSQIVEMGPISVGDITSMVGLNVNLPVVLNNTDIIKGIQFKLTLPQGASLKETDGELNVSLTERTEGMTIMGRKDPDSENSYLFILFSLDGNPITGNEGAIVNADLEIDLNAPVGKCNMVIEDVRMATSTFNTLTPDATSSELKILTDIRDIEFVEPEVKTLCISQWDLNDDEELDTKEAAEVNNLGDVFAGNTDITSFDELRYFTGLTAISSQDFNGCTNLSSIVIPRNVTTIEEGAFDDCKQLSSISVDDNNSVYDSRNNCNAIINTASNTLVFGCVNTVIPNSVEAVGSNAFKDLSNLTSLDIPNSVTTIGQGAFNGCYGLTLLDIPNGVTTIGQDAFNGCYGLTLLNIPESVTSIGHNAFGGCLGLNSIVVDENNTHYDSRNNCNAIIESETNNLLLACVNTTIPNTIAAIGNDAFRNLSGITSLIIPNQVESIGENAFNGCNNLKVVKLKNTTPIAINANVFSNRANASLYVPIESVNNYINSSSWNTFKVIKGYPNGDVNQDGVTDVVDVVDIARYVVSTPRTVFDENLADLNYDDLVSVADAVVLVNEIAGNTNWSLARKISQDNYDDLLSLTENEDQTLSLQLDGNGHYVAFQFDLILPVNVDVAQMRLNSLRKQKHQLLFNKVSERLWRVVALSTSNQEFVGSSGELLNIMLDGITSNDVLIENIHFITAEGIDVSFNAISLSTDGTTTGISRMSNDKDHQQRVYNLNGQLLPAPNKNVNIIGGKKVIVK